MDTPFKLLRGSPFRAFLVLLTTDGVWSIIRTRCGVEQRQLVGLITRRSQVRILAPLPKGTVFGAFSLLKGTPQDWS
jgi:hypothetical protein